MTEQEYRERAARIGRARQIRYGVAGHHGAWSGLVGRGRRGGLRLGRRRLAKRDLGDKVWWD